MGGGQVRTRLRRSRPSASRTARAASFGVAYAGLALAAFVAIGEELSWGQRLFGLTTPESVVAANRQAELNLHNVAGAESPARLLLFVAASYGVVAPLVLRRGPFVPPRWLVPAFAVAAAYFGIRFAFLPRPTYTQAKFSEWAEFCFAGAVALSACEMLRRTRHVSTKLRGRTR